MDLRILTEPHQGASYDDLLVIARLAEDAGFSAFFRSDHYLRVGAGVGLPGPTDAWVTLAGLARETSRIRLGTLVTAATFRHPVVLAISVAQVDAMSGGRVELGIGAGVFEEEHRRLGLVLPDLRERFDRYEEQLEVITGLWATPLGKTFTFTGRHHQLVDSPALPKPAQSPRPPLIIGGVGRVRTPELAARFADEFNLPFVAPAQAAEYAGLVEAAARRIGRDPGEIVRSVSLVPAVGRNQAEVQRRAQRVGVIFPGLTSYLTTGSPGALVDLIGRYRELAGIRRVYLDMIDLGDFDHVELIAAEVLRQFDADEAPALR